MVDTDPTKLALDDWIADLAISRAQAARGEMVPMETVLQSLDESIAELAVKLQQSKAAAGR
ncbi:MAG: hypothetical protein WCC64_21895 [Aliidongia sp.]